MTMHLKKGFITQYVAGTQMLVAVGDAAKDFHGLVRSNGTAGFIVDCLKTDTSEEEIVKKLCAEYDVDEKTALKDVKMVVEKLRSIGAIV